MKKVDALPKDVPGVFISGIRAVSEIDVLKKSYGDDNEYVIAFHTSMKTRFNRLNNPDKLLRNYDNFLARNKKELGYGVGDVMALADYVMSTENERWPYVTIESNTRDFEIIIKEILE